jgi:hypothetical protein
VASQTATAHEVQQFYNNNVIKTEDRGNNMASIQNTKLKH